MPSDSNSTASAPAQTQNGGGCIDRVKRRVIAIAGPVHDRFAKICKALKLQQQDVATEQLDQWNRKNERRAKKALKQAADSLD